MTEAQNTKRPGALIAMSGGVDSSVAAWLMQQAGYDCTGITMRLTRNETLGQSGFHTCCSEKDIEDAAASGGETNPQIMTFAALALAPMASTLTDEQIMSVSSLWPEWSQDSVAYKVDDVVRYSNKLWRCEQAHTSQVSWAPDTAPSLWSQIDIADDGIDVWTQPTGAHNAYNKGDRVHYPSKDSPIYESLIDGNSWSPDAYPAGWQVVTDADTE